MKKLKSQIRFAYYQFKNKPKRKLNVAMLHFGRCGSTVLGKMLNEYSQIHWDREVFHNFDKRYAQSKYFSTLIKKPLELLNKKMFFTSKPIYGFEVKCLPEQDLSIPGLQFSYSDLIVELNKRGVSKYICLIRKNHLKRTISARKGQVSQQWHSKVNTDKKDKLILDINQPNPYLKYTLLEYLEYQERQSNLLIEEVKKAGGMIISYEEDIYHSPKIAYNKVLDYCGLPVEDVEVSLRKTNDYPISEQLENYSQVKELLKNTPYQWMLEEN